MKKQNLYDWLRASFTAYAALCSTIVMHAQPVGPFAVPTTKVNPDNTVTFNYFNKNGFP